MLTLFNPPSNSLSIALLKELDHILNDIFGNPEVKILIILGAGRDFAIGADIKEMSTRNTSKEAGEMSKLGQRVFLRIENSPKPIIAAIHGFCLGGGLELAISCHIRIASKNAIMGMPEINLGMIPAFGGSYRLPKLVGKGVATQLILSGERIQADRALAIGLVNAVASNGTLRKEAEKLAYKLAEKSSISMCLALRSISRGFDSPCKRAMQVESDCVEELYESHDLKEGVFAFLDKRRPDFNDQ